MAEFQGDNFEQLDLTDGSFDYKRESSSYVAPPVKQQSFDDEFITNFVAQEPVPINDDSGFSPNKRSYEAYQYFKTAGYSDHEAIGIVSNLAIESANFSDDVISGQRRGDNGRAIGLAQWHPDRWGAITKHLGKSGANPFSFGGQLMGVDYELKNSEKKAYQHLQNTDNFLDSTNVFNRRYERSADYSGKRGAYATKLSKYIQSTGEPGYSQVGGYSNEFLYDIPEMKQPEVFKINEPYIQENNPNQELLDDEKESMMYRDQENPKDFSGVAGIVQGIPKLISENKKRFAQNISQGVSTANKFLSTKRAGEINNNYIEMLNQKEYQDIPLTGMGGKIYI